MNNLAIIPARGGSKGIPHKNIVDICGRPLLDYSIAPCLKSGLFSRVIVSTDNEAIAKVARSSGAEVPFLRPARLADDAASPEQAVNYTFNRLKQDGYAPDRLAILFPTHPFRSVRMLTMLMGLLNTYHIVKTVIPVPVTPEAYLVENEQGFLESLTDDQAVRDCNTICHAPTGTFFGVNFGAYAKEFYFHELTDPVERIDIDTYADLAEARGVIAQGLYDFS